MWCHTGVMRLWRVSARLVHWVAARHMAEALDRVRYEEGMRGSREEFDELAACSITELTEDEARGLEFIPAEGDDQTRGCETIWDAFRRCKEPTCFACSEW